MTPPRPGSPAWTRFAARSRDRAHEVGYDGRIHPGRTRGGRRRPAPRSTSSSARPASRPRTSAESRPARRSPQDSRAAEVPDVIRPECARPLDRDEPPAAMIASRSARTDGRQDGLLHDIGGRWSTTRSRSARRDRRPDRPASTSCRPRSSTGSGRAPPGGRVRPPGGADRPGRGRDQRLDPVPAARRWRPTSSASRTSRPSPAASAGWRSRRGPGGPRGPDPRPPEEIDDPSATRLRATSSSGSRSS